MKIAEPTTIDEYYEALVSRDESYLHTFLVGVRTTGIFCIATCRARKPKKENVDFYDSVRDVLREGFRPCKICKPTENQDTPPEDVLRALELLTASEDHRVADWQLREDGISPEKIRRWFNKNYRMTFQAYQRMLRVNGAFQDLRTGKSVTDSAFESGYDSLSGFGYTFKKLTGLTPEQAREKNVILMTRIKTPIGSMFACSTEDGICLLEFTDRRMLETELEDLQRRLNAIILQGENVHLKQLKSQLTEYFKKDRADFDITLDTPTTPFRQLVWDHLVKIPFGTTASYKDQAIKIGKPTAVRAVANANGHNRVAIVIPCHRIIGSDGSLTGYAGGLDRKRWLLEHEGAIEKERQISLF